ncbi:MAG: hypothetical protein KF861_19925 [Planctomycetaceae bacterium]|nr:hypothetical protein [Planctomycetaceae bacterium]
MAWLVGGVLVGLAIALYWPSEPAYAIGVSRGEKFAMCAAPTQVGTSEAMFVLDFTTGRLVGAAYNSQANTFTQYFGREVAADFGIQAGQSPEYVMVPARTEFRSAGGPSSPASGAIYIGEVNSGRVLMYGFTFNSAPRPQPIQQMQVIAEFPFRNL